MNSLEKLEMLDVIDQDESPIVPRARNGQPADPRTLPATAVTWLRDQAINTTRHAAALRPFKRAEFGTGLAAPSAGHVQSTNALISKLRGHLLRQSGAVAAATRLAAEAQTPAALQKAMAVKERAQRQVQRIEKIWSFYLELFDQRGTRYGPWLYVCDRISLDCYQAAFTGIGNARPVPAPLPFCYMKTGRSPATFRRGVRLRRLGKELNPFPLIELPYHRLVNPWTLGAILHEVSHNLQNDLGLQRAVPANIARGLLRAGTGRFVASVWRRWNREVFADLSGLLLGGPAVVDSLLDVVGRSRATVLGFNPRGVHPTPFLRPFLSFELLRRMGFPAAAEGHQRLWTRMYPSALGGSIPESMLRTFDVACKQVVDVICFRPYPSLGNKSLAQVVAFCPKDQKMVEEAAGRLAAGTPTGVLPERFLIGAARMVLDRRLARPGQVTNNFYRSLIGG